MSNKIIFLDRDGTLIDEPQDCQVDRIDKIKLKPNVIPALCKLRQLGYKLVMVTNQDGLDTDSFPKIHFEKSQSFLINLFESQGIVFDEILICPHFSTVNCYCRKPQLGLIIPFIKNGLIDFTNSLVIGDRETDLELANNLGIRGIKYENNMDWLMLVNNLICQNRQAEIYRATKETKIYAKVNLDQTNLIKIDTKIGFFDHMLEQLVKHGRISLELKSEGDLLIDEHHTVEDIGIVLGQVLRKALGDKIGINRYGFLLPMDEAQTQVSLDLSGRSYFVFLGNFKREKVGELPTELISHFFRSLAENLGATLHICVKGENDHHMIESVFKAVGKVLSQAFMKNNNDLPSTKGVL